MIGFIGFNFLRGFIAGIIPGSDGPTSAPAAEATAVARPATSPIVAVPGPSPTASAGVVDFGTNFAPQGATDCEPTGRGTAFIVGTNVWWLAHLSVAQPQDAKVIWTVTLNGATVTGGRGPHAFPDAAWTDLCGGPILSKGAGTYVVTVRDSTGQAVLSTGTYTLGSP
ncbi:MAG TPA: hypothetical protein VKC59_06865 [Candidatus Limnocylindrales bacterium]|nr:hypothetical protein [Candidatus Limnocylindrales bacterium]